MPAQDVAAITCQSLPGMTCWSSWSPRLGLTYDVFGDGKTALKASFGKYMTPDVSTFANQFNPIATFTDTRTWTDTDLAGRVLATNGDNIAQDNEIGPSNNPNFGKITNRTLDANFSREYNLQYGAGIQHQLMTGVAMNFNWFRRQLYNTAYTRNRAVDPIADWTTTPIVNPLSGAPITVFQINQNKNGIAPDLYLTNMTDTSLRQNTYTGFELGMNARLPRRMLVFGGWTMERAVNIDCTMNTASASATLNSPNTLQFCDQSGKTYQELGENATIPFAAPVQSQWQRAALVRRGGQRVAAKLCRRDQGGDRRCELDHQSWQHAISDRLRGARVRARSHRPAVPIRGRPGSDRAARFARHEV